MTQQHTSQNNKTDILQNLLAYLVERERRGHSQLPAIEMVNRMIDRVEAGKVAETELLINALSALQQKESRQMYEALELAVRGKRELNKYFEEAIEEAIAERDPLQLSRLQGLQSLLNKPPSTTRTVSTQTVDEALKVLQIKAKHPQWTYEKIATELYGDPSEAERLKKAVQRIRKAKKKPA